MLVPVPGKSACLRQDFSGWGGFSFLACQHLRMLASKAAGCSFGERQLPAAPSHGQSSFGYMRGATGWQDPLVLVLPVVPRAGV